MVSTILEPFIEGPLSDRRGGSLHARAATERLLSENEDLGDELSSDARARQRRLVIRGPEPLFDYQDEVVSALLARRNECCNPRSLVSLPTGAGKTRTAIWFFRELLVSKEPMRMVWVAPSIELVEQAVDCICDLWDRYRGAPDVTTFVNEIPSQSKSLARAHVAVFATAQLAARRTRGIKAFNPRLLVFDEAHHAVARTFSNSINVLKQLNGVQIVGLSATPGRMSEFESQELSDLFSGELITSTALGPKPIDTLVQRGVLSRIDLKAIEVEKQWDAIRVRSVKGRSLSIDELALHAGRFWATVGSIENLPDDSKTLVFGASIAHCFALAGALCVRGIPADVVSHNTPDSRRKQILARFRHGDLKVLINKSILATGYDCPAISDVVLATPIRSASLWEQIVGRVSRGPAVGGTEVGRVWELDDHHSMHKKVMSYARYLGDIWDR